MRAYISRFFRLEWARVNTVHNFGVRAGSNQENTKSHERATERACNYG